MCQNLDHCISVPQTTPTLWDLLSNDSSFSVFRHFSLHGRGIHLNFRCWHDPNLPRPEGCTCPNYFGYSRCANPECNNLFRPQCRGELFCCWKCFFKSDFQRIADIIEHYEGDLKKVREYLRKVRYRKTVEGKAARQKEYEKERENPRPKRKRDRTKKAPLCHRIGCAKPLEKSSNSRIGQKYCCPECREFMRQRRKAARKAGKVTCPVAEYILDVMELLYN